ncbi:RNA recognition motif domain-containing protein [Hirsutella rhossiliensis]|uniref:RNA recognition motif domain-containing protein n=1 Tax=Hirsutella rhossiliensis TaxID=111463 RepID=A0A9P8MQF6_9HYPO|nr:RNA recognition motif domain-containing protein [Hirsutella rhossiliensis]KAH0960388.1 RNA recognition motif domain-containing protein [Hirsutella rhossiliensis]
MNGRPLLEAPQVGGNALGHKHSRHVDFTGSGIDSSTLVKQLVEYLDGLAVLEQDDASDELNQAFVFPAAPSPRATDISYPEIGLNHKLGLLLTKLSSTCAGMTSTPPTKLQSHQACLEQVDCGGKSSRGGFYPTPESSPSIAAHGSKPVSPTILSDSSIASTQFTKSTTPQVSLGKRHEDLDETTASTTPHGRLDDIIQMEPTIPKAISSDYAPSEQRQGLEQILGDRLPHNRNVYIQGLHPTTDDKLLEKFALRFGSIESIKVYTDRITGACLGCGFAKFYEVRSAEECIRAFYRMGYKVGFACELAGFFPGYTCVSCNILRDSRGDCRGDGFVSFDSREVSDEVIREFHGTLVGPGQRRISVRYAETPAQRELRRITAQRRQTRVTEYKQERAPSYFVD